ncbi:MAG: DUF4395 family protein [Candidatus Falkowbacteria bacterium]
MKKYKPVSVPSAAFVFCRVGLAVLVWLSFIFHSETLLVVVFVIFVLSAVLKIKRAPMIWLYSQTINKIFKSKDEILDEHAMSFAHLIGSMMSGLCLVILFFFGQDVGWTAVFILALLKSISACGFCPASKLYTCATNDSCCAFAKNHGK